MPAIAGNIATSVESPVGDQLAAVAAPAVPSANGTTLRLAVAANFRAPLNELAGAFEHRHGVALSLTFGSSGLLAAQIRQGAPFDAFFSADRVRPEALIGDGLAVAPVTVYARGRVALRLRAAALRTFGAVGTPASVPVTPAPVATESRAGVPRVGMPNPQLAPYGAAAMQCLDRLGVRERFRNRLVFGNNVNQVDHFLESGGLDLGFVALSQLVTRDVPPEHYWVCPAAFHAPIEQGAVVLRRSNHGPAARELLRFMTHPDTQNRLAQLGYLAGD